MRSRTLARGNSVARMLGVGLVAASAAIAFAREVPKELRGIVLGDRNRAIERITLNGTGFESLRCFSDLPYLMWPAASKEPVSLAKDPEALRAWLARAAPELGFAGFTPRFVERFDWRGNEVFSYELVRHGLVLHDARVMVHWRGTTFLGIQNHLDGRILSIQNVDPAEAAAANGEQRYYAVRVKVGEYAIVPATIERVREGDRTILTLRARDGSTETIVYPDLTVDEEPQNAVFTEYRTGVFPDQISVAEDGIVWFSQPNSNSITSFDPVSETFTLHDTAPSGASGPDGLIVGTQGRVWSGMYYSGSLGWYDTRTGLMHNRPAPYADAAMAIPVETSDGSVWVTDHARNRISEFDPAADRWLRTVLMPTPNCWVVQGFQDFDRGQIYFTEYNANQLGRIALGGNVVTDIATQGGGPAFCAYAAGKVYYSRWNESGIGVYDVNAQTVTEYQFPVPNESGGPLWVRPNGDIVVGTRNRGYVMYFHAAIRSFTAFQIPTPYAGLKDGMTVGGDSVIWFTESGVNKIARLKYSGRGALKTTGPR